MPIAAKALLFVLRSKKGRRILIATIVGLIAAVVVAVMMTTTAIAAMFSSCKEQIDEVRSSSGSVAQSDPSEDAVSDIPDQLLEYYRKYGEQYGVDWALVAAVGKQESNHGQDYEGCATSEDAARGIMQFIPSTWETEGIDANGDGTPDPCSDEDAVASGASYLKNLGADTDEKGALCSYYGQCADANANYAEEVLAQADAYRSESGGGSGEGEGSGGGSADEQGSISGGMAAFLPPLMSEAHAVGISDTPAGWSLVEQDKTMTYWSETRFDSYLEAGAKEWDALGGVEVKPAESKEEANVVVYDGDSLGWAMGYTQTTDAAATKGTIEINEEKVENVATETNRKALMVHELGHALGFNHQNGKDSVMNQDLQQDVPTEMDVEIYKETWGGEGSVANADPEQSYGEEEVSEECEMSIWPWA